MSELFDQHKAHRARLERIKARALWRRPAPPPKDKLWFGIVAEWPATTYTATAPEPEPEPTQTKPLTVREVQSAVAAEFGVKLHDMISDRRTANIVRPRQIAMYLAKELTLRSLPEIGRMFGGRDHTTVLHAVRKITLLVETDETVRAEVTKIREGIGA